MTKPFLLIKGELLQKTDATFGGNGESTWVDHVLCRDGKGRCTLRGETLAGALLATAKKLFNTIPDSIKGLELVRDEKGQIIKDDKGKDKKRQTPSVWRVFTSHPITTEKTAVRQNVRIDEETGAAAEGALFDSETLTHGTKWSFFLEVDLQRAGNDAEKIKEITLYSLQHWTKGYCWLGGSVARGLGWFELQNVHVIEASWDWWPNSNSMNILETLDIALTKIEKSTLNDALTKIEKSTLNDALTKIDKSTFDSIKKNTWQYKQYTISLNIAPAQDDYGIDFLSVGGHSGDALLLDIENDLADNGHLLLPQAELTHKNWYADAVFAYSRDKDNNVIPYISGSSLRGVLRHAAFWWAKKQNQDLTLLNQLFGTVEGKAQSGALLISDAHLTENCNWQAVLLKMHAEDEFAGGVYTQALFDRLALVQACFTATIVLEAKATEINELNKALQPAIKLAKLGFLGLGGQAWRGFGHLKWQIEAVNHEQ